jgi:hypothetical protein
LFNINKLKAVPLVGTEGAKWTVRRESGKPGSGVKSERCIRNYLGGDEDHIALK